MTKRDLIKTPLKELLPDREIDTGVESHARRLLSENRARFERMFRVSYPGTPGESTPPWMQDFIEGAIFELALVSSRVNLLNVRFRKERKAIVKMMAKTSLPVSTGWIVSNPTLISSFAPSFYTGLLSWVARQADQAQRFISRFLAELSETASSLSDSGVLALIGSFLLKLASILFTFDRLVERLTRRVLAPGGQTARFIPLT